MRVGILEQSLGFSATFFPGVRFLAFVASISVLPRDAASLRESEAVVPSANPAFNMAKYDLNAEGAPGAGHFGSKITKAAPAHKAKRKKAE